MEKVEERDSSDVGWETFWEAGGKAFQLGRYADAEKLLQKALTDVKSPESFESKRTPDEEDTLSNATTAERVVAQA